MDYPLENLDPEKFQQFCQALLTREFPNLQCFPVAQPDGGRDALEYLPVVPEAERSFLVYQVKFVRNSESIDDPREWLLQKLREEAPKVAKLIPKGAKQYFLITNVAGTAHPESGSIDEMTAILRAHISLPAMCWWRDDINRRLDTAWDLKWAYPEVITGQDVIRHLVYEGLSEDKTSAGRCH